MIFLLMALTGLSVQAQGVEYAGDANNATLEELLAQASEADKPIFVKLYADWCGPCKKMDKRVLSKKTVGKYYNDNFLNVKLNTDYGLGQELAGKFGVRSIPAYLFINSKGKLSHSGGGEMNVEEFVKLGQKGAKRASGKKRG